MKTKDIDFEESYYNNNKVKLHHAVFGLVTTANELVEALHKESCQEQEFDKDFIKEKLRVCSWMITKARSALDEEE